MRDRLVTILEHCYTKHGFDPHGVASWEADAILSWRDRNPLVLSAYELDLMTNLEKILIGRVTVQSEKVRAALTGPE